MLSPIHLVSYKGVRKFEEIRVSHKGRATVGQLVLVTGVQPVYPIFGRPLYYIALSCNFHNELGIKSTDEIV